MLDPGVKHQRSPVRVSISDSPTSSENGIGGFVPPSQPTGKVPLFGNVLGRSNTKRPNNGWSCDRPSQLSPFVLFRLFGRLFLEYLCFLSAPLKQSPQRVFQGCRCSVYAWASGHQWTFGLFLPSQLHQLCCFCHAFCQSIKFVLTKELFPIS